MTHFDCSFICLKSLSKMRSQGINKEPTHFCFIAAMQNDLNPLLWEQMGHTSVCTCFTGMGISLYCIPQTKTVPN